MSLIKKGGTTKGIGTRGTPQDQDADQSQGETTRNVDSIPHKPDSQEHGSTTRGVEEIGSEHPDTASPSRTHGGTTRGVGGADSRKGGDTTRNVQASQHDENRTKSRLDGGTGRRGTRGTRGTAMTDEHLLQPDSVLQNRYVIESVLGIGGMSVVYRGRDLRFKDVVRHCAIKEMYQNSPDSQTRALSLRFFEREAGMLATLNHTAIPKVYDFFEENNRVYLVLELIPGPDLELLLEDEGQPISEDRVGKWAVQICDVMEYLHSHEPEPIVFRDMKPSNIVISENDRVVMVDFGIARALDRNNRKGTMIGTEGYAAPEQFRGIAVPASDIYGLGATLHQLLTCNDPRGETPFTFNERPIRMLNPAVSAEMEAVVTRALEYDLQDRWSSAREFKEALLSVPSVARSMPAGSVGAGLSVPDVLRTPAAGTELLWKFGCEDEIRSSPCVASGMLFVGCYDTNLYALDTQRGEFRWKYATGGGINAIPSIWGELVLIGSEDGIVYAIDMRQGQARWKFRTEKPIRSSPRVEERVIFVGSDDQHIYAIDGMRGTQLWKYRTWMPIRSSALISGEVIYIGGDDQNVYCLDIRTGGMRWKQRTKGKVVSTPAEGDGLIFVGSGDNHLYALDSQGGWPAWRFRTGHVVNSSPLVLGTRVFVGSADGSMYAIEVKNGRQAWKFDTGSQIASSPRAEGGRIYFGAVDGFVYCVDAGTGDLVWKYQTDGPIVSTAAVVDGVVYIGSMDQHVYALKA